MSIQDQLNQALDRWSLLRHPFYQAWENGSLPVEALRTYAREYGAFIRELPAGWETLADVETAAEEREHAEMWAAFASGLQTQVVDAELPAVAGLVARSEQLFAQPASALGALYAFEAQQPATAKSKLEGLRKHYALPISVEHYFEAHSANQHEAAKLLQRIGSLSVNEQATVIEACEQMAEALWNALTDIYDTHCQM